MNNNLKKLLAVALLSALSFNVVTAAQKTVGEAPASAATTEKGSIAKGMALLGEHYFITGGTVLTLASLVATLLANNAVVSARKRSAIVNQYVALVAKFGPAATAALAAATIVGGTREYAKTTKPDNFLRTILFASATNEQCLAAAEEKVSELENASAGEKAKANYTENLAAAKKEVADLKKAIEDAKKNAPAPAKPATANQAATEAPATASQDAANTNTANTGTANQGTASTEVPAKPATSTEVPAKPATSTEVPAKPATSTEAPAKSATSTEAPAKSAETPAAV